MALFPILILSVFLHGGLSFVHPLIGKRCLPFGRSFATFQPCEAVSKKSSSWSVADDWNQLSSENPYNSVPDASDLYNQDIIGNAAFKMELSKLYESGRANLTEAELSAEEQEVEDIIQKIYVGSDSMDTESLDSLSSSSTLPSPGFMEDMGQQIAQLVRCNQAGAFLQQQQADEGEPFHQSFSVSKLILLEAKSVNGGETCTATTFFREALSTMFDMHCTDFSNVNGSKDTTTPSSENLLVLDAHSMASWLDRSLDESGTKPSDIRVKILIEHFGASKTYLTKAEFEQLYMTTLVGPPKKRSYWSYSDLQNQRGPQIDNVWRDLRNHGLLSASQHDDSVNGQTTVHVNGESDAAFDKPMSFQQQQLQDNMIMDECELLPDEGESADSWKDKKSSHQLVELAYDNETPLWIRDGKFVYIDEESCIGCTQCVAAAPSSFQMTDTGRARAFAQRNGEDVGIAVTTCPVDCIHFMSFSELKRFEEARDHGDGRTDHKHFGYSRQRRGYVPHTPLHVSSQGSLKDSWYHYLRNKCSASPQCPQRGCYDCPAYSSDPESNPYFQERLRKATHIRAEHFKKNGMADRFRKTADL